MEDVILILERVRVENANAIAGLTWGFPSITNFLGFVHSISRKLPPELDISLNGCGVVCHERQVLAHQPRGWGDYVFALTRNPLTAKGETASFNEEGRMHMTVSLVIPVLGDIEDIEELEDFKHQLRTLVLGQRLAGGTIVGLNSVSLEEIQLENKEKIRAYNRRWLRRLLPGFALVQRSDVLNDHFQEKRGLDPDSTFFDAWLDFAALRFQADQPEDDFSDEVYTKWRYIPRPGRGWLVPITTGYRSISELYEPGEVANTRDQTTPFRFVEAIYTIGEWISPHRLKSLDELIWYYRPDPEVGWYLCENNYVASL